MMAHQDDPAFAPARTADSAARAIAETDLALRGLAGEDIAARVEAALRGMPGVHAVQAHPGELRVHVAFDPARVTHDALRAALDRVGTIPQRGTPEPG